MIRPLALGGLAALAFAGAGAAQDFNADPPNAAHQKPAFAGQTRAPVLTDDFGLATETFAGGLDHPWGLAQLPDGGWLVTERAGRLRQVSPEGKLSDPIAGLPKIDAEGQGGLLDVLASPDFAKDRRLWFSYTAPEDGGNHTAVATATLSADGTRLEDVKRIFAQVPVYDGDKHFGGRLVLDGKGGLIVTLGERSDTPIRDTAQQDDNHLGKLVRIDPLTGAPMGAGIGLPETWAKGFRNVQAATFDPQGQLWTIEHGPEGGDELNRVEAGKNYGWPVITYGQDYGGDPINEGITAKEGMEQPVYYWDPVIAPSGMLFYDGGMFPEWQGDILIGGMKVESLVRLTLKDGKVAGEARYPLGVGRVRDVAVAQDGALMILTDEDRGEMVRVSRK